MEKVSNIKIQSQYLNLIVKKTIQDRLSTRELETYCLLKSNVDPLGELEEELTNAWKIAEEQQIHEAINSVLPRLRKKKFSFINLFKKKRSH